MSSRQITEHFNEDELRCRCGCGLMEFSDQSVRQLEALRVRVGRPLIITSGYRCPEYNDQVSLTGPSGPHTITDNHNVTVDIGVSGKTASDLVFAAMSLGFTGIGVKQSGAHKSRFIHIDRLGHPRPRIWSY